MIDILKKTSSDFFNKQGYPSKKLENWKFTSSKKLIKFVKQDSPDIVSRKIKTDESTLLFINGKLCLDTLENFKFKDNLEIQDLVNINDENVFAFSNTFSNDAMFNLGMSDFESGHYIKFKISIKVAAIGISLSIALKCLFCPSDNAMITLAVFSGA